MTDEEFVIGVRLPVMDTKLLRLRAAVAYPFDEPNTAINKYLERIIDTHVLDLMDEEAFGCPEHS